MKLKQLLLLLLLTTIVSSESLLGMRYPTGISTPMTGYSARMGGTGIGDPESYLGMSLNPGNLGNVDQSVYTLKLQMDYLNLNDGTNSSNQIAFVPQHIGFVFPLKQFGTLALSFLKPSYNKYTYKSENDTLVVNSNAIDGQTVTSLTGNTAFYRDNGISAWEIGYGFSFFSFLKAGVTYRRFNYYVEDSRIAIYDGYGGTIDSTKWYQEGNMIRGGISGGLLKGKINYGVTGSYPFSGDIDYDRILLNIDSSESGAYYTGLSHEDAIYKGSYKLHLPPEGGAGFSVAPNKKLIFNVDYYLTLWEKMSTDAPQVADTNGLKNSSRVGFGAQFTPATNMLKPRYFELVMYSAGFRYETLAKDGDFEMAMNLGVGLPLGKFGIFDFGAEAGLRKSESYPDYEEKFVRLSFTTSGGRKWKKKKSTVY
jgi:hypothetical protein